MNLQQQTQYMKDAAAAFPFPIAIACKRFVENPPADPWQEWERLSRDILTPVLQYLSHLMLSDLVATGQKPPHLYHRIQSVLSRPMAGHYAGFLREAARYIKEHQVTSALPELVDFLYLSEVECSLTEKKEPILGKLVDLRNLFAHGRIDDKKVVEGITAEVRGLTSLLFEQLRFLEKYPLELADGTSLMGANEQNLAGKPQGVRVRAGANNDLALRPLLLKLNREDLVLLEDHDIKALKLVYKGSRGVEKFGKKEIKDGEGCELFEAMLELLRKVRSDEAVLSGYDWESFRERAAVISERTLSLYEDMHKYIPKLFVPRPEWEGESGIFSRFIASNKTLLAVNGVQGTGKSALAAYLASGCLRDGHSVLLVNAQRFTFADVTWSGNPYATYFSQELHYEKPLDKQAFRSLVKGAPEGKMVIFFIDAINEVDGIENKWNRFKAMELLLEWIAEVAQPGVKVVLSFRLEAYERFEYLQIDELPKNLMDISFPGTNSRKPWIIDLDAFDEFQAEALYGKLQTETSLGMAPVMSWSDIRSQLGDRLHEFTSNPLLFTIFLRSHHQESKVYSTDQEGIFSRYAEKLTGATEVKKLPWWERVIGFLRNGNITPKERLLADLISKMAEEGGAAFLVERLESKKNKRDRRLMAAMSNPKASAFSDLKDAGLLIEESISFRCSGQEQTSRRITFVGELMVTALEEVHRKIGRILALRTNAILLIYLLPLFPFFYFFIQFNIPFLAESQAETGHIYEVIFRLREEFSYYKDLALPILFLLPVIMFLILDGTELKKTPKSVGVFEWSFLNLMQKKELKHLFSIFSTLLISSLLVLIAIYYAFGGLYSVINSILIVLSSLILSILLLPWLALYQVNEYLSATLSAPMRLKKQALTKAVLLYSNLRNFPRGRVFKIQLSVCLIMIAVAVYYWIGWGIIPSDSLLKQFYGHQKELIIETRFLISKALFVIGLIIMPLMFWLYFPLGIRRERNIFSSLVKRMKPSHSKEPLKRAVLFVQLFFFSCVIIGLFLRIAMGRNQMDKFLESGFPQHVIGVEDELGERIASLDLREVTPDIKNLELVGSVQDQLIMLVYRHDWPAIDLSKYGRLNTLFAPAKLIHNLEKSKISFLYLDGECEGMEMLHSTMVKSLTIPHLCQEVGDIGLRFPNLKSLALDEASARFLDSDASGFKQDLELHIGLEKKRKAPLLDWLSPKIGERVILNTWFDSESKNLQCIKKLRIAIRQEIQTELLHQVINLHSLYLILFWNDMNIKFLTDLRQMILTELPHLEVLEIEIRMGNEKTLIAHGKEKILKIIDNVLDEAQKKTGNNA